MTRLSPFIVLIERRRWRSALAGALASLALLAATAGLRSAHAGTAPADKIAADLQAVVGAAKTAKLSWTKEDRGIRYVKVLVIADSSDPTLAALRADVLAKGGSVYMRYLSVNALSAMLPASAVGAIAARSDVQGISPNRLTARTASALEAITGTLSPDVRTYQGARKYSGLDGTGVGIAVLDSGIEKYHSNLLTADGLSFRVKAAVDFQKVGDATAVGVKDWAVGVDASAALTPGSATMANYESVIDAIRSNRADRYGHGSHVASIAAGRGVNPSKDATGIAPNANLYDVKVLDGNGYGQTSDVLAGIDWVISNARQYNIRVMNLSLAADSTETWQTDPLARAARSAVAAGITVVVAAGNFGQSATGAQRYGTISSPGHEPSVITVGSANSKGTTPRNDDTVNLFSSRGPTRGSYLDSNGVRQTDNLLKPDLVAPGNKIVGALATNRSGAGGSFNYLAVTYPALMREQGGASQNGKLALMMLSGTSVAAPVVSGAVALMLQANPGLTPPLIKAILQYSAQALPNANLLQQGAGLLNIDGAVRLARAARLNL